MSNNDDLNITSAASQPSYQSAQGSNERVNPIPNTGKAPEIHNFLDALKQSSAPSSLSANGRDYRDRVSQLLDQQDMLSKITRISLPSPADSLFFVCNGFAFGLCFHESVTRIADSVNIPASAVCKQMEEAFSKHPEGEKCNIIGSILVTTDCYRKPEQMATHILNVFNSISNPMIRSITAKSMNVATFDIITNRDQCNNFVERNSPHGVPLRNNLQMLVVVRPNRAQRNQADLVLRPEEQLQYSNDTYELVAISAYTTFNRHQQSNKFIPLVNVTDVISGMWSVNVLPIALHVARECLLTQNLWKNQFLVFNDKFPNVGNLLMDQTGNDLWRVENTNQVERFFAEQCTLPSLFLQVTDGRAQIPGWSLLVSSNIQQQNVLRNMFDQFFGREIMQNPNVPFPKYVKFEYTGTVSLNGETVDTRKLDYLQVVLNHKTNAQEHAINLLSDPTFPNAKLDYLKKYYDDITPLYFTHTAWIPPEFINAISSAIAPDLRIINTATNMGTIDMSSFVAAAGGYSMPMQSTSPGMINNNPFSTPQNTWANGYYR